MVRLSRGFPEWKISTWKTYREGPEGRLVLARAWRVWRYNTTVRRYLLVTSEWSWEGACLAIRAIEETEEEQRVSRLRRLIRLYRARRSSPPPY